MNRVLIVVLNWNGIDDTEECVDSLVQLKSDNYQILVVDNGSKDDSRPRLEQLKKSNPGKVEVIYNSENLGFAGGVNVGIKHAIDYDFDLVALFNNDATADKNWLSELVNVFDSQEVGIATGLLLHADGQTIDSSGDFYSKWGLPFPRNRGDKTVFAHGSGEVFGASGGASVYRVEMLRQIGLFDEDFFAYYEDVDTSFRAQLAGWKVGYNSEAIAYHKQGATSRKIPGFTVKQTFKNLPWLYIKNVPRGLLIFIGSRLLLAYILMFGNAIKNGSGWPAFQGFWGSLIKIPAKISERLKIQKNKKVSADYINKIIWDDLPPDQTGLKKLRSFITRK